MNINHLEEKISKLPEDHPERIYWEKFIAEQYEKLSKGLYEQVSIYEMDEDLDFSKMYISIYHYGEVYSDVLGSCSTIKQVVEDLALAEDGKEKSYGNSFSFDIIEINFPKDKAIAAYNAWKHGLAVMINFKVETVKEYNYILDFDLEKIVNVLHFSPLENKEKTYSSKYVLE